MITLYTRDIKENHKARYNELKIHSLRTELKKLSKRQTNFNITLTREQIFKEIALVILHFLFHYLVQLSHCDYMSQVTSTMCILTAGRRGKGVQPPTKFSKKERGLTAFLFLEEGYLERAGEPF